jgi:hypothetical protein
LGHRSIIPYAQFFCIAPVSSWSTELEEGGECVLSEKGLSCLRVRRA